MKFKEFIKTKTTELFKKLALSAVIYAEKVLGSENGSAKKEIAIDFLLSKLPLYLKPIVPFIRQFLVEIADKAIEKAVGELHKIQERAGLLTCGE